MADEPQFDSDDEPCTCEGFDFSPTCPRHHDLAPSDG